MTQEERLLAGLAFCPGDDALRAVKLRCHELCARYNALLESQSGERAALLAQIFAALGEGSFLQGPIYIHYGVHTRIGARFFGNFNLTIQDDAPVTIGDDCNFGPGVTIVTPLHPMLPQERRAVRDPQGQPQRICWAKPVNIGSDCWFGANVTVCPRGDHRLRLCDRGGQRGHTRHSGGQLCGRQPLSGHSHTVRAGQPARPTGAAGRVYGGLNGPPSGGRLSSGGAVSPGRVGVCR